MSLWFFLVMVVAFKIPILAAVYLCWYAIKDPPDQVVGDGGGGSNTRFQQGPRTRGPRPGGGLWARVKRRREHAPPAEKTAPVAAQSIDGHRAD
ncbi:MAG: hypothetical protein JHC87_04375 [Thermoleophilaceae bacterium]|nr:hypothetical protein [Thermoleophilaceae bacterium]